MAYVNYFQQKLPSNAVTDASEIQALENFAKHDTNNKALDWLAKKIEERSLSNPDIQQTQTNNEVNNDNSTVIEDEEVPF